MQSYDTRVGAVHHFDLWRLEGRGGGLAELGWDEARGDIVLVEWPDRLGPAVPDDALVITLTLCADNARHATLAGWPDRIGRLA